MFPCKHYRFYNGVGKPAPGKYKAIVSNNRFISKWYSGNNLYDIIYIRGIKNAKAAFFIYYLLFVLLVATWECFM